LNDLGRRSDLVFAFGGPGGASAAARLARLFRDFFRRRFVAADGRRENIERDGLAAIHTARLGFCSGFAVAAVVTVTAIVAARPIAAVETVAAVLAVIAGSLGFGLDHLFLALVVVGLVVTLATRVLVLEASAVLAQHAEIMVRELEKIFGLDAVARKLGVARHALVFFQELGGVAALAIVLAVPRLSAEVPTSPLSPAAASAATLSIIDQMPTSLSSSR
jgi:hypothetical protein